MIHTQGNLCFQLIHNSNYSYPALTALPPHSHTDVRVLLSVYFELPNTVCMSHMRCLPLQIPGEKSTEIQRITKYKWVHYIQPN